MLYPSIQELLKATEKDGKERLNKYSITMATAKCARVITNEYAEQSYNANKKNGAEVKKEYKDEKSVKNALSEMKAGDFEIYLPGEEGYEESMVEIKNYQEPKEEPVFIKSMPKFDQDDDVDDEDEATTEELMGATNVYEENDGFSVEEAE